MTPDSEKKVDESWKNTVENEKTVLPPEENLPEPPPVDFLAFVSTLAMQALMAMGEMAHPETGAADKNFPQARYLIDILQLLSDKSKGNLSGEEANAFKNILHELKVKFVKRSQEIH